MGKKDLDNKIIQAGMFNEKASDAERNNKLRDLISKDMVGNAADGDDEDSADEIFTEQELNYELSRTEDEMELFTKMDAERYAREGRDEKIRLIREKNPHVAHR